MQSIKIKIMDKQSFTIRNCKPKPKWVVTRYIYFYSNDILVWYHLAHDLKYYGNIDIYLKVLLDAWPDTKIHESDLPSKGPRRLTTLVMRFRCEGLLDRDSFASQLATQMQMERLHPKIEMLFTNQHCWVPCIYAQASLQQCLSCAVLLGVLMYESYMGELTVWIVFPTVAICMYRLSPLVPLNSCLTAAACLSSAC